MAKRSCGFVGLPGGFGTFEEVLEVTTWTQIGIHTKRNVFLNLVKLLLTFCDYYFGVFPSQL
jgi:predicted Rossmann-fold nucleotide-binding protein